MLDVDYECSYCGSKDINSDDDVLSCLDCQSTDIIWNVDND